MRKAPAPRVSVVIPTFNRRPFLARTLAAVYAQTFSSFEVIVVDDGSTDGTARWLSSRRLPRLTLLSGERNSGPARARNRGLAAGRGELVAFLDSDDLWRPEYLATMTGVFRDPGIMVAFSDYDKIDEKGRVLVPNAIRRPEWRHDAFVALSGFEYPPLTSGTVMRREACREIGSFDESFRRLNDDTDYLLRAGLLYGPAAFRFVPRSLVRYRRHRRQLTNFPGDDGVESAAAENRRRDRLVDMFLLHHKHLWWTDLVNQGLG
jgi:glycosyltransferase involved in cell wall biosynthesis